MIYFDLKTDIESEFLTGWLKSFQWEKQKGKNVFCNGGCQREGSQVQILLSKGGFIIQNFIVEREAMKGSPFSKGFPA